MQFSVDYVMVCALPPCATPTYSTMIHPVTGTAKYKKFDSMDALAKALIHDRSDIVWKGSFRTLAAKIGLLDKGTVTWWRNLPEQTQALADFLDIPVDDLGVLAQSTSFAVSFSDFPALKPLDLKREAPWRLGQEVLNADEKKSDYGRETLDAWLEPNPASWRPPFEQAWLQVDSPIEQQLLTQKMLAAGRFTVLVVPTLADAAEPLQAGKPLIISVSMRGGDADFYALAGRPDAAGLLVIAPFPMPTEGTTSAAASLYGWELLTSSQQERRKSELTHPNGFGGFKRWTWKLSPDWRLKLLDWVGARLERHHPDPLFSVEDAQKWLVRFDPQSVWFSTPSDLLQLCRLMNVMEPRKLPIPSDKDGGIKLTKALYKAGPAYRQAQMLALVQKRWAGRGLPWGGGLPMQAWLSLSPDALVAVSPAAIAELVGSKNLAEVKKRGVKLAESAELGNPETLLSSGLIQLDAAGGYDFQHRTLATLLVRDTLLQQIVNESAASWGWACFDAERRPLVDAVLDALSLEQLADASQQFCVRAAGGDDGSSVIGAVESLFMAVGRRIASGDGINALDFLPLAQCVISQLDMTSVEWALPVPWSRPTQTADERLQWISACWAWSLLPNANPPACSWLFPGWCQALPEGPWWISELWVDEKFEPASPAWLQFLRVIDEWLKEFDLPVADAPRALNVALLARAATGQWLPEVRWWASISECVWAQDALIKRLEALGTDEASQAAVRLWPSRLMFERGLADDKWTIHLLPKIRRWLLGTMKPAAAIDALSAEDVWYLIRMPASLPPAFRPLLLKKFKPLLLVSLEQNPLTIAYGQEEQFFERFGAGIAPLLCDFLTHERLGFAAAKCLWRWDAEAASQRLKNPQHLDAIARQHLLVSCPASYLSVAVTAMQAWPALFDVPYLVSWARELLPNSGTNASALLALLKAAEVSTDNLS